MTWAMRSKQNAAKQGTAFLGTTIFCVNFVQKTWLFVKWAEKVYKKFALANLPDCTLLVHPQNAEIPGLIAEGKADVMITETMEARRYTRDDARLAAPLLDDPFTKNQFGILMQKGDQAWLNYVNFFMEEKDMDGTLDKLEDQYIK